MRLAAIDIGTNSVHMIVVQRPAGFLLRDHRPGEGNGPPGRRRARRAQPHRDGDGCGAAGADEISPARPVAPGRRDHGGGHQRDARSRKRPGVPGGDPGPDRHPAARHLRHGRSPADPHGGRLRRGHQARQGRGHRHRRRQRRGHRRQRAAAAGAQLQDRRHPHDRALREDGSAGRARRAKARAVPAERDLELRQAGRAGRVRARDRHVGHDPQPGHDGRVRDGRRRAGRAAEPPHSCQADSQAA